MNTSSTNDPGRKGPIEAGIDTVLELLCPGNPLKGKEYTELRSILGEKNGKFGIIMDQLCERHNTFWEMVSKNAFDCMKLDTITENANETKENLEKMESLGLLKWTEDVTRFFEIIENPNFQRSIKNITSEILANKDTFERFIMEELFRSKVGNSIASYFDNFLRSFLYEEKIFQMLSKENIELYFETYKRYNPEVIDAIEKIANETYKNIPLSGFPDGTRSDLQKFQDSLPLSDGKNTNLDFVYEHLCRKLGIAEVYEPISALIIMPFIESNT